MQLSKYNKEQIKLICFSFQFYSSSFFFFPFFYFTVILAVWEEFLSFSLDISIDWDTIFLNVISDSYDTHILSHFAPYFYSIQNWKINLAKLYCCLIFFVVSSIIWWCTQWRYALHWVHASACPAEPVKMRSTLKTTDKNAVQFHINRNIALSECNW